MKNTMEIIYNNEILINNIFLENSNSVWSLLFSAFSHTSLRNLLTNIIYLYPLSKSGKYLF